jgi:hypothetical protein
MNPGVQFYDENISSEQKRPLGERGLERIILFSGDGPWHYQKEGNQNPSQE